MIRYETMYSDELMHHGVKNQQWGVHNGPPYPLTGEGKLRFKRMVAKANKTHYKAVKAAKKVQKLHNASTKKSITKVYKGDAEVSEVAYGNNKDKKLKKAQKKLAKYQKQNSAAYKKLVRYESKQSAKEQKRIKRAENKEFGRKEAKRRRQEAAAQAQREADRRQAEKERADRDKKFMKGQSDVRDINSLTNDELAARTKRLQLENNYKEAMANARTNRKIVQPIIKKVGKQALTAAATGLTIYAGEQLFEKMLGKGGSKYFNMSGGGGKKNKNN